MHMTSDDIEFMARQKHACPNVRKGVRLLLALVRYTNANSDGWGYARAPARSAEKLVALLRTAGDLPHALGSTGTVSDKDLKAAITPIRRMATVQREKQKKYGNTFDFDVDAALAEPDDPGLKKAEPTPGEWRPVYDGHGVVRILGDGDHTVVACFYAVGSAREQRANVRLVVNAKRMLSVCKEMELFCRVQGLDHPRLATLAEDARKIIADVEDANQ